MAGVEYAIRDIALEARKLQKEGKKITYLNIGDPLQYGFQPPDRVKEALIKAVREGQIIMHHPRACQSYVKR